MTKEQAIEFVKTLSTIDDYFSDLASIGPTDQIIVTALTGWVSLNGVRQTIIRLAEISGVDSAKDLIPELPMGKPVVVLPVLLGRAIFTATQLALRQSTVQPLKDASKLVQ